MTSQKFQSNKNENFQGEFLELTSQFCQVLKESGIFLRPLSATSAPVFEKLPDLQKRRIIFQLKEMLSVIEEMHSAKESPSETGKFLWRSLSRMKLTPSSDIFDRIADGDAVVVYDLEHRQIFRSLGYYASVSASLEEIVCLPWWEIHQYPDDLVASFQTIPDAVRAGHIPQTIPADIPTYRVKEVVGIGKITTEVTMKWFSPIRENSEYVGIVTVSSTKILN